MAELENRLNELNYLLLQTRRPGDNMRQHEVSCFERDLQCRPGNIAVHDLIGSQPTPDQLTAVDAVLLGGSGDFSVVQGGRWLPRALETVRYLYEASIPTFASCWGFQAFAQALGGQVATDLSRAELGTIEMQLTDAAHSDPIFAPLGSPFFGQMGHQDIVIQLPDSAVLLASSDRVENEAFKFPDRLIYATQFHPELTVDDLRRRLEAYPDYLKKITGLTREEFYESCRPTPETTALLIRFATQLLGNR